MPDFLLELFSEEIPARMQAQAAEDLKRLVTDALAARNLFEQVAGSFATPRRLALHIEGLPARQRDTKEVRKGPRTDAPDAADQRLFEERRPRLLGRGARSKPIRRRATSMSPAGRGRGTATEAVLAEILPPILADFPWPKSMRWGARSAEPERFSLGAPAACDPRHLRPGDGGAGDRPLFRSLE